MVLLCVLPCVEASSGMTRISGIYIPHRKRAGSTIGAVHAKPFSPRYVVRRDARVDRLVNKRVVSGGFLNVMPPDDEMVGAKTADSSDSTLRYG